MDNRPIGHGIHLLNGEFPATSPRLGMPDAMPWTMYKKPSGERLQFANWKITIFKFGKSTISMGHVE